MACPSEGIGLYFPALRGYYLNSYKISFSPTSIILLDYAIADGIPFMEMFILYGYFIKVYIERITTNEKKTGLSYHPRWLG